jgi:hypothetical protein
VPTSWAHVRHGPRSTILDLEASYGPSGPSDELDGPKSLAHRQSETVSHSHRPPPHLPAVTPVPSRRAFPPPAREPPPRGRDTAARSLRNPHVQARLSRVRGFFSPAFRFFARCAAVDVRTHFWDCLGRCVRLVSRSKRIGGRQNEKCA